MKIPSENFPSDAALVLLGEENSGRDEMNLAGNPFALLQASSKTEQNFIENEWERRLPDGKIVKALWRVNGDVQLGLPGPAEELLYLILLQITRESADENGVWPQEVPFGRGDLLTRLKWSGSARNYQKLADAFERLKSVSITAKNTFWDARAKAPIPQTGFNLIDNYSLVREPSGTKSQGSVPLSSFKWNDVLYKSFGAGNVRSFALDFAISLNHPTSVRLFRYLDMMRGATTPPRREFAIGLFKLREKLGMTDYKYASKIKEKLKPAIDELKGRNYLEDVLFESSKEGNELAHFIFEKVTRNNEAQLEQGSVEVLYAKPAAKATSKVAKPKAKTPVTQSLFEELVAEVKDIRLDALRCHTVFSSLPPSEQAELVEKAKQEVSPIWHDRIGLPESPMSLGLWKLVAERYPEELIKASATVKT